ncbi:interleukin-13 receptor subunit alpha-1-like [Clarias magur]|uniref:Interleukin-13 receptor subunit alpha-1-like n=1 Tax=Clarias magur TaxID=1594786 RepID=A0A8J4U669_CLAMG|nr:interleukin-13 receptor subunit alpha-1-like [Clarias magur]
MGPMVRYHLLRAMNPGLMVYLRPKPTKHPNLDPGGLSVTQPTVHVAQSSRSRRVSRNGVWEVGGRCTCCCATDLYNTVAGSSALPPRHAEWSRFQSNSQHDTLGELPPPENLRLSWHTNNLKVQVRWQEPAGLDKKCIVNYTVVAYDEECPPRKPALFICRTEKWTVEQIAPEEKGICVGINTNPMNCAETSASKVVYKYLSPPPALVKNFSCAYYANEKMNCTWSIVKNTPDLQLLYREMEKLDDSLKPCKSYIMNGNMKTGCHLHDDKLALHADFYFVITGTEENVQINNRFIIAIYDSVKLPKPKVNIIQEGDRLRFQASLPNFIPKGCLKYKFIYTKCNEKNEVPVENESSTIVEYDTACKYTVQGLVLYSNYCGRDRDITSDLSEPVDYGMDSDPNLAFKVAIIITPLIVCCCLIAAIVLFRRNKDIILPKIPEPSLFFKDMLNSTSDGLSKSLGGGKLYVPVKEVVASGVSLEPKSLLLPPDNETCI